MKALQINLHTKINSLGESGEIANGQRVDFRVKVDLQCFHFLL